MVASGRAGLWSPTPASADLDAASPRGRRLGTRTLSTRLVEVTFDSVLIDVAGKSHLIVEAAHGAFAAAKDADGFLLPAFAEQRDAPTTGDLDVDVVALNTGQLDLHDVGVIGLLHVSGGCEGSTEEIGQLTERVEIARELGD